MLSSDEGDNDVFFDSVDSLSAQDCVLAKQEFGSESEGCGYDYEVWVNEPLSVKERRGHFLQAMGLADATASKVCSQDKMVRSLDASSISLGLERIRECSGAVSNACNSPEKLVHSGCKAGSEAKFLFDELKGRPQYTSDASFEGKVHELCFTAQEHRHRGAEAREEFQDFEMGIKKKKNWWKSFVHIRKGGEGKISSKLNTAANKTRRIKVSQNKKRWLELSGLYIGQEIRAHKGLIWTMKFSPNGQYLASGGEDGVGRIWRVISLDTSSICFTTEDSTASKVKHDNSYPWKKHSSQSFIFLPNKIFQIENSPLQEFYGHSSDVLDLAWSNSDILLSSSMDKTVRLWQIGSNQCLSVFRHNDYVTCIQFNPVDENYFISGSIDGKVRIWGIREERVVDWADIRDVISAISYQQDGKGFVVGSVTGMCHFYVASGVYSSVINYCCPEPSLQKIKQRDMKLKVLSKLDSNDLGKYFLLEAQILVHGKKKASGNKITGIQFSQNCQRIMITSEDSKIRILDGIELVQKYKGLPKSGSQMHGSFTSSGKHIISVGEDSRVYIWNYNDLRNASSKQTKSEYSCEYFFSKGVTVAIPWSGMSAEERSICSNFPRCSSEMQNQLEAAPSVRDSERFSLGNWFSIDGTCRGSMTWPEEKLPSWDLPLAKDEYDHHQQLYHKDTCLDRGVSETWGLTIVAAGCDGTIKTFHNFGLPVRL